MRKLIASAAALSIACVVATSAVAAEPVDPLAGLQPLDAAQLDDMQGGFIGMGIVDVLTMTRAEAIGFGDGIRGRIPSSRSFRETDFDFVSRAALRHAYKARWSN